MTDCSELMAKLNAIDAKLNSLDSKYIPKSQRGAIVEEGAAKGKGLALAAILPMLGAFATKGFVIGKVNPVEALANLAQGNALSAKMEASNALGKARNAAFKADNALSLANRVRMAVDDLAIKFNGAVNNIVKLIRQLDGRIARLADSVADALQISRYARKIAGEALGVAFKALAKILNILMVIESIFSILNAIDLRRRMGNLERRAALMEADISRILSILATLVNRVGRVEGVANQARIIAQQASSLGQQAQNTAQQAREIGNRALGQASRALAQAVIVGAAAAAASGLAGRALQSALTAGGQGGRGLMGLRGPAGPRGLTGPRGAAGVKGADGKQGLQGQSGQRGQNGLNGKNAPVIVVNRTVPVSQSAVRSTEAVDNALLKRILAITSQTRAQQAGHIATSINTNEVVKESRTFLTTMQEFAKKAWKTTRMQKVLDLLTFVGVMHNVSMLSRDIGETMGYVVSQGLSIVGIKDEEDNPLDVNQIVGTTANNFVRSVLGDAFVDGAVDTYRKANRIVQSASMVIWTIRSIQDTSLDLLEWVGENTGKIGNALKRFGVVGERSYPWMAERAQAQARTRARFAKLIDGLERTEDVVSSYSVATSNVLELSEEIQELGENWQRFRDSLKAEPDPWFDNPPVQTEVATATAVSASPNITAADADRSN